MLAGITRVPELMLAQPESDELAKALNTVSSFYNVEVAEKTVAWINLSMVAGMIYGTRLMAIRNRRIEQRRASGPAPETNTEKPEAPNAFGNVPDDYIPGGGMFN